MAANQSTENIKMGTCKISLGGADLGLTMGGVEVEVTTSTHETKVDQFGDTIVNERIMGRNIVVKAPLAETTLERMAAVMPAAELITDNTDPQNPKKKVVVKTGVGTSLLDIAAELVLHPIDRPDSDVSEDLTIPLAATAGAMNFAYKYDQERVFNCDFKGYPDADGVLFLYGDKTVTNP